ncbi:hypothetical protein OROMI_016431 [Orobanche minor]
MLEKKQSLLQKKASAEVEKAKAYTKAKNKGAAKQCLKRKRLYEEQMGKLANFAFMIRNIDDVDKTMDEIVRKLINISYFLIGGVGGVGVVEINEQTENLKQIQEALATPIGAAAYFDEDELEAELEEFECAELEEQFLQPASTAQAAQVQAPAGRVPARPAPQKRNEEEDEIAALQAEMAL